MFHSFSSLLSGLLIFMTRWAMMLNGTLPSVMVSHNYTPTHQSRVVRTSYHCRASWGLKNLSPGTYSPTPSLPFLMEGRRLSLLQCTRPADIDHAEIRWQFNRGAIPTICLLCWIVYMPLGPGGQLLSVLEKPLVKINLCLNPCILGSHEMATPREWAKCNPPPP